ncbi:MAG: cell division protein ZapA [Vicinamibacterales bacterium]
MGSVVQVDIHGQRYMVRSDLDPQYVCELASYVDEKMRSAACEVSTADPLRIAVIAALNLSDELYRLRSEAVGVEGRARNRVIEIERIVDAVLDGARVSVVNE